MDLVRDFLKMPARVASILIGAALVACQPAQAPDSSAVPPDTQRALTGAESPKRGTCVHPELAYRIEYPAGWHTNPGNVMPECSLFDRAPIQVDPGTEIPFDIAVSIRREPVPFETVTREMHAQRELARQVATVSGREAVRIETENVESLLRPAGSRSYRYFIGLGGETLIAATHDAGDLGYERKKQILDEMIATLTFPASP